LIDLANSAGDTVVVALYLVHDIVGDEFADKVEFEILDIEHLPFVNPDLEADGCFPDSVTRFRQKVLEANAIILACPEYNYSIPGRCVCLYSWSLIKNYAEHKVSYISRDSWRVLCLSTG
jgi:hypothetical protein